MLVNTDSEKWNILFVNDAWSRVTGKRLSHSPSVSLLVLHVCLYRMRSTSQSARLVCCSGWCTMC
jgi:hypothetical protein